MIALQMTLIGIAAFLTLMATELLTDFWISDRWPVLFRLAIFASILGYTCGLVLLVLTAL